MSTFPLVSVKPSNPLSYLGFAKGDNTFDTSSRLLETDRLDQYPVLPFNKEPVFICIDLEKNCSFGGKNSRLSEVGLSLFDTRDVGPRQKPQPRPGTAPGPRGDSWRHFIKTIHYRISDNLHTPHECSKHWHKGDASRFAFGGTRFARSDEIQRIMMEWFGNVLKRQLRPGETKRYIILASFASRLEEQGLKTLDIPWFEMADEAWDIQRMRFADVVRRVCVPPGYQPKSLPSVSDLLDFLGVPYEHELLHNGGNDAAWEMQVLLAGLLLSRSEWTQLENGHQITPILTRQWQFPTIDRNIQKP